MSGSRTRGTAPLPVRVVEGPGAHGAVWLSDEAWREYEALKTRTDKNSRQEAVLIGRHFKRYADLGPEGLDNPKMFKPLQRIKSAGTGKAVQVFEIKAYQWRVYGVRRHMQGRPAFVGLCVDPAKKQNKADPSLLKRCADMACLLADE